MNPDIKLHLCSEFQSVFSCRPTEFFHAPGRIELIGNHTDHQHGCAIAAAVDLEIFAAVAKNDRNEIRIHSAGFPTCVIQLTDLTIHPEERTKTAALIRGTAARFQQLGFIIGGFDAFCISEIPSGSGLSSSAAFETLIGSILNHLYNDDRLSSQEIAQIGQFAENEFFGKPCGLLDQLACSVGGCIFVNFRHPEMPEFSALPFSTEQNGYSLCIIDSGASHDQLTEDYACIPKDMRAVSALLHVDVLSSASETALYENYSFLRHAAGDQAVLRSAHFFDESHRVQAFREAVLENNFPKCLSLLRASCVSSATLLQNVIPTGSVTSQPYAAALACCRHFAGKDSAVRPHGGGFAGTILAVIPQDQAEYFRRSVCTALDRDCCQFVHISPLGAGKIKEE